MDIKHQSLSVKYSHHYKITSGNTQTTAFYQNFVLFIYYNIEIAKSHKCFLCMIKALIRNATINKESRNCVATGLQISQELQFIAKQETLVIILLLCIQSRPMEKNYVHGKNKFQDFNR
jgi:hypothetical protein